MAAQAAAHSPARAARERWSAATCCVRSKRSPDGACASCLRMRRSHSDTIASLRTACAWQSSRAVCTIMCSPSRTRVHRLRPLSVNDQSSARYESVTKLTMGSEMAPRESAGSSRPLSRFSEPVEELIRVSTYGRVEHHLAAIVGRIGEHITLVDERQAGRFGGCKHDGRIDAVRGLRN
jgi:hypothetical protein